MVHVDALDLELLTDRLTLAKTAIGKTGAFVFKHLEADTRTHEVFYEALLQVPSLSIDVLQANRGNWEPRHSRPARGDHFVSDCIINLLSACPPEITQDQMLLIDLPRREKVIVDSFRTTIRQELRRSQRAGLRDVRPRPDHRADGTIIQAADMIAGEVRQFHGLGGPFLPRLGQRIRLA